jgi:hypothetical protein
MILITKINDPMIVRIVKMTFKPELTGEFLQNFEANKKKIRAFEGCERLLLLQDIVRSNIYFTYSWWQSPDHRQSSLFKGVWRKTKQLFEAPAEAWSTNEVEALR